MWKPSTVKANSESWQPPRLRKDFVLLILSHGRPDRVKTVKALEKSGYTGKWYVVIDDEDSTAQQYRDLYGDKVLQFCKSEYIAKTDSANPWGDRRGVVFARNAAWSIAERLGIKWHMVFDDDYIDFRFRHDEFGNYITYAPIHRTLDSVFELMIQFMEATPIKCLAFSQGGDWISGAGQIPDGRRCYRRKVMNSFLCNTDRPFAFRGIINEDVSTYLELGRQGDLFLTLMQIMLTQVQTQTNARGLTDIYKRFGTYIKSFYSVMYAPSCCKVSTLTDWHAHVWMPRFHHLTDWNAACPKIVRQELQKQSPV